MPVTPRISALCGKLPIRQQPFSYIFSPFWGSSRLPFMPSVACRDSNHRFFAFFGPFFAIFDHFWAFFWFFTLFGVFFARFVDDPAA
jgi:hypothetical protein